MARTSGARSSAARANISLLAWMLAPAKTRPPRDSVEPLAAELGEAEQHQCVNQRKQVIDLKAQVVGQVGQVGGAVMLAEQDLGQAGQAVHGGLRQRGIPERAGDARARPGRGSGGSAVALGHHPVYLVDERLELRSAPAARPGQRIAHVGPDPAGVGAEDEDPVGEQHRLLDVVRDHDDGLGREPLALPEFQQLAAQVLGVSTSSALNGSSISSAAGSTTSARAKPTRWRMPPDSSLG